MGELRRVKVFEVGGMGGYGVLLSSLSMFENVVGEDIPGTFCRLLLSLSGGPRRFLNTCNGLYSVLYRENYTSGFTFTVDRATLFSSGYFTHTTATNGRKRLPRGIISTIGASYSTVLATTGLASSRILRTCACTSRVGRLVPVLPG